jgi:hypothetical protein
MKVRFTDVLVGRDDGEHEPGRRFVQPPERLRSFAGGILSVLAHDKPLSSREREVAVRAVEWRCVFQVGDRVLSRSLEIGQCTWFWLFGAETSGAIRGGAGYRVELGSEARYLTLRGCAQFGFLLCLNALGLTLFELT